MSVQDSESRRFEQIFVLVVIGPQELLFPGFLKSLKLFLRRFVLIASGTEIFYRVRIFEITTFYGNMAFPLSWKHSVSIVTGLGLFICLCLVLHFSLSVSVSG